MLDGYVIDIENQKARVSNGVIQRIHLLPDIDAPLLILLDWSGKQTAGTQLFVPWPLRRTVPSTVTLPPLRTSRPAHAKFKGRLTEIRATLM